MQSYQSTQTFINPFPGISSSPLSYVRRAPIAYSPVHPTLYYPLQPQEKTDQLLTELPCSSLFAVTGRDYIALRDVHQQSRRHSQFTDVVSDPNRQPRYSRSTKFRVWDNPWVVRLGFAFSLRQHDHGPDPSPANHPQNLISKDKIFNGFQAARTSAI